MPAFAGRLVTVNWNSSAIAAREKSIAINGEPVDVSDDSSEGWRDLLAVPGEKTVNLSISGLTKSHDLRHAIGTQAVATVTYPTGQGSFTGTFQLVSYTEGAPYKDSTSFDAELQSSGPVTFTAPE